MLNSIIRADLHIHSKASEYREYLYKGTDESIVAYSDASHLNTLLDRLKSDDDPSKSIQLFSITDHDTFDTNLYREIVTLLNDKRYGRFANVLPGVEFTVTLEEGHDPVHVVTLFDVKAECWDEKWCERLEVIATEIGRHKLAGADRSYEFHQFVGMLSKIGYRAILIAHQFDGLNVKHPRKTTLSRATNNPGEYLTYGVFDALEFTRTRVEGILLNELTEQRLPTGMVAGSDCHDWRCYPHHDKESADKRDRFFTELRCLPTFRGLLCALTSPSTRIRVTEYSTSRKYVESVHIEDLDIPLSPGLNAIIGENGAGKSTVLDTIGSVSKSVGWHRGFIKAHSLSSSTELSDEERIYIEQGSLVKLYGDRKGALFDSDLFPTIHNSDNQQFEEVIRSYSQSLKEHVEEAIRRRNRLKSLEALSVDLHLGSERITHAVEVIVEDRFSELNDPYTQHASKLEQAENIINREANTDDDVYSVTQRQSLLESAVIVESIKNAMLDESSKAKLDAKARGVVEQAAKEYSSSIQAHRTTEDTKRLAAQEARRKLINSILQVAHDVANPQVIPVFKDVNENLGVESVPRGGFEFTTETKYHEESDLKGELLKRLFNGFFHSEATIGAIDSERIANDAVTGGGGVPWRERWDKHVNDYISDQEKTATYIGSNPGTHIGGTLGEQAIAYYKFQAANAAKDKVILIDQPEDNVSNSSIASNLVPDISKLRYDRQVVLVTHNPLLVVNLDVDNVIVLEHRGGKLAAHSGCLESTDNGDILDLVANHMDGGSEAIRRRLKLYGE